MQTVFVALIGVLGTLAVTLLGSAGTRSASLRHLREESELIASLPPDDPRRALLEEASLVAAERYRDHAKEPSRKRIQWLGLLLSLILLSLGFFALAVVDPATLAEKALIYSALSLGLYGLIRFINQLSRG